VSEVGGGGAAKLEGFVAEADSEKFNAEEVGGDVAEVFDGMAFEHARADAEGSGVGWRANKGRLGAVFFFVGNANGAGVVKVDVDRGGVGVVVDGDFFVRTVVDADDTEGGVFEDGGVVGWEGLGEEECGEEAFGHGVGLLVAGDGGVDGAGPGIDAAGEGLGAGEALVAEPEGYVEGAGSVVTHDDDGGVGVEFGVGPRGDVAHGNQLSVGEGGSFVLPGFADIQENRGVGLLAQLREGFGCDFEVKHGSRIYPYRGVQRLGP
jgi:hypothetical protein